MELSKYSHPFSYVSQSNIGILLIHGFTSTTSSMMYLAQKFSQAGFNIELPCLRGHGTSWQDLDNIEFEDWIMDLEQSLQILKKRTSKIFLCGLSLGGALALRIAQLAFSLQGIILINHACIFTHPKFLFVPIIKHIIPSVEAIANDIKDSKVAEKAYNRTSIKGLYQLLKLLKQVRIDISKVECPTLIFKSKEDHVIPIRSATFTYKNIKSECKDLVWLYNSYHVASLDFDKDIIVKKTIEFINESSY